mmetsp:Transcript_21161/g.45434  ORF Transcript_21161/g.45434 Transcript_21161/m.45434 type:complete len:327 (-) Transcript_21161:960-1940(-)
MRACQTSWAPRGVNARDRKPGVKRRGLKVAVTLSKPGRPAKMDCLATAASAVPEVLGVMVFGRPYIFAICRNCRAPSSSGHRWRHSSTSVHSSARHASSTSFQASDPNTLSTLSRNCAASASLERSVTEFSAVSNSATCCARSNTCRNLSNSDTATRCVAKPSFRSTGPLKGSLVSNAKRRSAGEMQVAGIAPTGHHNSTCTVTRVVDVATRNGPRTRSLLSSATDRRPFQNRSSGEVDTQADSSSCQLSPLAACQASRLGWPGRCLAWGRALRSCPNVVRCCSDSCPTTQRSRLLNRYTSLLRPCGALTSFQTGSPLRDSKGQRR